MTERLMGLEMEYAFVAFNQDGSRADGRQVMSQIERLAEKHIPHLQCKGQRGIFLQNASRFYRDFTNGDAHQEMTTPECPNPWDVARYTVANEQILLGLTAQLLQENGQLREALYFRHNVDYSGSGASWGLHESYLTRTPIGRLPESMLPHLASRIIFTGAGGFNPFGGKLEFMLSPRAAHLTEVASLDTERNRPLFNVRDEPLCNGGYHRLHVISGESLCSHTSQWLRAATTSLVVALADGGVRPGIGVALANPVEAMHLFAKDPTCRVKAPLASGKSATAIEIQRHFLRLAEAHVAADFMPPWAPQVCQHWRAILDLLEQGAPESVATTLDWAIKYALFTEQLNQRGLDWNKLATEERIADFESLRQQMFEVDVRFGQLGERGIFNGLDRAGVLRHQFPGVDNFPHAMVNPPNLGRALLRGNVIKKLSGRAGRNCCDWDGVWDLGSRRWLDLSTPFAANEEWKPIVHDTAPAMSGAFFDQARSRIENSYDRGSFEEAAAEIRNLETRLALFASPTPNSLLHLKAWVQARRGHVDGVEILNRIYDVRHLTIDQITDYLLVLRFSGLGPRPEMEFHIRGGLDWLGGRDNSCLPLSFPDHWGAWLIAEGRPAEAEAILEETIRTRAEGTRSLNRTRATLANAKRLLGKPEEARALLEEARQRQTEHQLLGSLNDFTLPNLAKVAAQTDLPTAQKFLTDAKVAQVRSRNRLGLIRTLLLEARLAALGNLAPHSPEAIQALAVDAPALATCQLYRKIMERWEAWSREANATESNDVFWGI